MHFCRYRCHFLWGVPNERPRLGKRTVKRPKPGSFIWSICVATARTHAFARGWPFGSVSLYEQFLKNKLFGVSSPLTSLSRRLISHTITILVFLDFLSADTCCFRTKKIMGFFATKDVWRRTQQKRPSTCKHAGSLERPRALYNNRPPFSVV